MLSSVIRPVVLVVLLAALAVPTALAGPQPHLFDAVRRDAAALSHPQPYLAKIDASQAALDRGNTCASRNILGALSNQVRGKLDAIPPPDGERAGLMQLQADVQATLREYPPGPCVPPPDGD